MGGGIWLMPECISRMYNFGLVYGGQTAGCLCLGSEVGPTLSQSEKV